MSTAELKLEIINRITHLQNENVLEDVLHILAPQEEIYILSEAQKKAVREAQEQVAHGQVFSHEEVFKEIRKWRNV